jgi:hypothetical protein
MDEFDRMERLTRRVGRAAVVGVPSWILLLWVVPLTGLGVLGSLLAASALESGAVVAVDRRDARRARRPASAPGRERPRPRVTPGAAVALTLGAVALLAYVIWVASAA